MHCMSDLGVCEHPRTLGLTRTRGSVMNFTGRVRVETSLVRLGFTRINLKILGQQCHRYE